ncbi:MAG: methyltransferase domain-containing protein [Pseudomonadota bacterium]
MRTDAIEIDRFYRRRMGGAARAMALRRLRALWPEASGLDMLGYGFATPYLEPYRAETRRTVSYMPSAQGAVRWPEGASLTSMGDEARLPFNEAMFDRIVLAHALEEAGDLRRLLRELWRVMAPEGRMVIIAAHRAGAWARADSTPFGHGRPYSRAQLTRLLSDALFEPVAWARALYAPPWRWASGVRTSEAFEHVGERLWAPFGGLILVEAVKHVGAVRPGGSPALAGARALEGAARPALSGARRGATSSIQPGKPRS